MIMVCSIHSRRSEARDSYFSIIFSVSMALSRTYTNTKPTLISRINISEVRNAEELLSDLSRRTSAGIKGGLNSFNFKNYFQFKKVQLKAKILDTVKSD